MVINDFRGYIEGHDITKIPVDNLSYPTKNVFVNKGKITTRGGLENDGTASTTLNKIHSEFVWKDSVGGIRPIRATGQKVQVKYDGRWYTIYENLDSNTVRCYFATWVDSNTSVTKKRLIISDGSTALYVWNGAISKVASATTDTAVLDIDNTCLLQGFDDGSGTVQKILHFIGTATTPNSIEDQNNNPTAQTLAIAGTFDTTPVADDVIIAQPVKFADAISSDYEIDTVYSFQNHLICANFNSVELFFSHISTYALSTGFDFIMPASSSRTAESPIYMRLDGNFTAMISRKNILWVSDADDWYKLTKTIEQNAYDLWVDVEKFETGDNKGALPMALAKHKGDIIYVAQDKTVQRVTSVEIIGDDEIRQISDDIEVLLQRTNLDDVRVYYLERAIYFVCPTDSVLIMLDLIEDYWQPPQTLPLSCISVIDGVKYGHHNAVDETFKLFSGRSDLGTPIESKIAFGYQSFTHGFRYKWHTMFGVSCRLTGNTEVTVEQFYEEDGAKAKTDFEIIGATVKTYAIDDDVSWATHPYAERSWGGADMESSELRRAMVYNKFDGVSFFDFRPIFTITGIEQEFHLLGWYVDDTASKRKIGSDLFIDR